MRNSTHPPFFNFEFRISNLPPNPPPTFNLYLKPRVGAPALTGRAVSDDFGIMGVCGEWMTRTQRSSEGALTGNVAPENRDIQAGTPSLERGHGDGDGHGDGYEIN